MEYALFLDHNRRALLQYRDLGKTRYYVGIVDGSIDVLQLGQRDFRGLKPYVNRTPEQYAEVMSKSTLPISRTARAILGSILGLSEDFRPTNGASSGPRFSATGVTIEQLAAERNWNPSHCRRFLRKCMEKPGGRWVFSPEKAEEVVTLLTEFFNKP